MARVEDAALLRGEGRFVDDVALPGQRVLVFVRSPHAHARIRSIDVGAAQAVDGVDCIVTGAELHAAGVKPLLQSADFKRVDGSRTEAPPQYPLAVDIVRYVGEPVAAIVAATRAQARDAAEAVMVDYDVLPHVIGTVGAARDGAPLVWPDATSNIACEARHGDAAAVDRAIAQAATAVTLHMVNQRVVPAPIEPRATLAWIDTDTGRLTLRASCQTPTGLRDELCTSIGIEPEQVRVLVGDVGGGFGMKTTLYAEDVLTAWCARNLGQPVKWTAERVEEMLSATHGRDVVTTATLALDAVGKITALRVDSYANVGAYATPAGVIIQLLIGPWVTTSVYDIPAIDVRIRAMLTHTTPTGPYRGAGRPEAIYFLERLMDAAARKSGIDAIDLRRRNFIAPAQMPYRNPMDKTYDTGHFEKIMDGALAIADGDGFAARVNDSASRDKLRGRGMATFLEWTGAEAFSEDVSVTVSGDGYIEMFSATQAMGQGLATSYAQLAVDVFGVPIDKVRILQGDTDRGTGFGSAGSRSLYIGGSAIHVAATETVKQAQQLASDALEAAAGDIEYRDGVFRIAGTDREIGLFELAARQSQQRIAVQAQAKVEGASWPNGCHICEVEIDPMTGAVEVDRYWSMNDVGRVVNPTIVVGQLEGGAVQGIGQALCEHIVYDEESGQLLTGTFLDYAMPRAAHVRHFDMRMDPSVPSKTNILGAKGVGELGTIGATPTVVNAVVDALVRAGAGGRVDTLQMPLTPERVLACLRGGGA